MGQGQGHVRKHSSVKEAKRLPFNFLYSFRSLQILRQIRNSHMGNKGNFKKHGENLHVSYKSYGVYCRKDHSIISAPISAAVAAATKCTSLRSGEFTLGKNPPSSLPPARPSALRIISRSDDQDEGSGRQVSLDSRVPLSLCRRPRTKNSPRPPTGGRAAKKPRAPSCTTDH